MTPGSGLFKTSAFPVGKRDTPMAAAFSHRARRKWLKIILTTDPAMTEAAAGLLTELTNGGIEIAPTPAVDAEQVIGYLELMPDGPPEQAEGTIELLRGMLAAVHRYFPERSAPELRIEPLAEEDWGNDWKQHFKPFAITPHLMIRPSWEPTAETGDCAVIEMDPGLAFGTGHHQSTRLALRLIDDLCFAQHCIPDRVLDVGTGTGVLGMACGLFGAREVLAVDNDPDAVAAAADNVSRNGLEGIVRVSGRDVTDMTEFFCYFDLIVANITHDVLIALAPTLNGLLAAGGHLILAGILAGAQADSIRATFAGHGLQHMTTVSGEEWVAMDFVKTKKSEYRSQNEKNGDKIRVEPVA
ncbi:MAG: hypothetical protein A2521_03180 [Deltaproteobacteria bacterium RIFOXYD12_FULL_57_12]|nr:MAG: hypothetical protein A2521_03180 [Deltaproteobacteria bacterium RIFOXYD12_FULL_57_12]